MFERKKRLYFLPLLLCIFIIAKNINAGVNRLEIIDAIYVYRVECVREHRDSTVDYEDMESYGETFLRWWDWSGKRILDAEDYRTIKPYIGQVDSAEFAGQYFGK